MTDTTRPLTDAWATACDKADRLRALREKLIEARASGVREVAFGEDRVVYRSDSELAAALNAVTAELNSMERRTPCRTYYPVTSKGLV